jgi:hypothetical protein
MVHRLYHDQSWMHQRAWMHMATSLLHIQFRLPCTREKFAIIELQTLRFICYCRIPNVDFAIIGLQTLRHCYYKIWTPFNQFSWRNTCICDMIWRFWPWPFFLTACLWRMPWPLAASRWPAPGRWLHVAGRPARSGWPLAACMPLAAWCLHAAACRSLRLAGRRSGWLAGRRMLLAGACTKMHILIYIIVNDTYIKPSTAAQASSSHQTMIVA